MNPFSLIQSGSFDPTYRHAEIDKIKTTAIEPILTVPIFQLDYLFWCLHSNSYCYN